MIIEETKVNFFESIMLKPCAVKEKTPKKKIKLIVGLGKGENFFTTSQMFYLNGGTQNSVVPSPCA